MRYVVFLEKMVDDPCNMFENNADLTKMYNFDLLSHQQKADFTEMVFPRQRSIGRCLVNRTARDDFLNMLKETYKRKRDEIISCLDSKLNFYGFSSYFCSFFRED